MGRRIVSGALGAGAQLGMLALAVYTVNVAARSWAAYRLASRADDVTAEAVLFGF